MNPYSQSFGKIPQASVSAPVFKKTLQWTLFFMLGVLLSVGIFHLLGMFDLSLLKVSEVTLKLTPPLTEAAIQLEMPDVKGKNLIAVKGSEIVEKLGKMPWVDQVTVKKVYPHELFITVNAKKPLAVWLEKGVPYYLDGKGEKIAPTTSVPDHWDLPMLDVKETHAKWSLSEGVRILIQLSDELGAKLQVSQLVLEEYPYFRFYTESPRLEVLAHFENWQSQIPKLQNLIPRLAALPNQTRRINLVFSKKAIVSPPLSN